MLFRGMMRCVVACCYLTLSISVVAGTLKLDAASVEDATTKQGADSSSRDSESSPFAGKTFRIIAPQNLDGGFFLPRSGSPVSEQINLAQDFAKSLGMEAEMITMRSFSDMIPALEAGEADIIVANLTITEERKKRISFSVPVDHVREALIVRKNNEEITKIKDLKEKSLLVHAHSSFWQTAVSLLPKIPTLQLYQQNAQLLDEDALDLIAKGKFDATIRDSNIADMYLGYRDDLKVAFEFPQEKAIAWGVRPNATRLKEELDKFLTRFQLAASHNESYLDDLEAIKKRGYIRIILRNNSASYFLWRGMLLGFEYEMAKAYARHLGVRLVVVVPPSGEQVLPWLQQGKADIAAGFLTPTAEWQRLGLIPSTAYHEAYQHLVVADDNGDIRKLEDLEGKSVIVHRSSAYWSKLHKISQEQDIDFKLIAAPEDEEIEEILHKVAEGIYESTLVDGHLMDIELASGLPVRSAFTLGEINQHALAVRAFNPHLLDDLNSYINTHKDGKLYARLYKKYFKIPHTIKKLQRSRLKVVEGEKKLSPYDKLVKQHADKYGFDWRLLVALMYRESHFIPTRRSKAGAVGLMQLMPATARQMGYRKLTDPAINIKAGVRYLDYLYNKFEGDLPVTDRIWFTFASYNAGYGHVLDARRLAAQLGLDRNRWFDNVEKAMLLLSKPRYHNRARYGYVRGSEPVKYVRSIKELYETYLNLVAEK